MFALTLQECDQVCLPAQLAVDAVSSAFALVLQVVLDMILAYFSAFAL